MTLYTSGYDARQKETLAVISLLYHTNLQLKTKSTKHLANIYLLESYLRGIEFLPHHNTFITDSFRDPETLFHLLLLALSSRGYRYTYNPKENQIYLLPGDLSHYGAWREMNPYDLRTPKEKKDLVKSPN